MAQKVKPSKQSIVNALLKDIEAGTSRAKVLGKAGKTWGISRTTFDRHWKTANEQHRELQEKAKAEADKVYIDSMADAAKSAVMSKAERQKVLSDIARGQLTQKAEGEKPGDFIDVPVMIETFERIKAIAELNKMEGDYAPSKVAQTDKDGNDVLQSLTVNVVKSKPVDED